MLAYPAVSPNSRLIVVFIGRTDARVTNGISNTPLPSVQQRGHTNLRGYFSYYNQSQWGRDYLHCDLPKCPSNNLLSILMHVVEILEEEGWYTYS